jgi:3-methyladenine DNA glycosylase AlkD
VDIAQHDMIHMAMGMALRQIASFAPEAFTQEKLRQIDEDLARLS